MHFVTPSKKNKITPVNVLLCFYSALLRCDYFSLQTLQFLLMGGTRIFLVPGRRVPYSYTTALGMVLSGIASTYE